MAAERVRLCASSREPSTEDLPLEPRDSRSGADANRTVLGAARVGVARGAAVAARHVVQDFLSLEVPLVVDERPSAVERSRTQIVWAPLHHVAGAVARCAVDALDARVRRAPCIGGRVERRGRLVPRYRPFEASPMRCSRNRTSQSRETLSKKLRMSASTIHLILRRSIPTASASRALCAPRPGRNP